LLKYFIKRLPREKWKSLSVTALALALVFLINVLGGIRATMEEQYEFAMDELPIHVEVSDGDGSFSDGLNIGSNQIAQFTDPDMLWTLEGYVKDVQLKRSMLILDAEAPVVATTLTGIGWIDDITYIASDYNDNEAWNGSRSETPDQVSEVYPDPDVSIEYFEGFEERMAEFFGARVVEEGKWVTDWTIWPTIIVSEDLEEFIVNGWLQFTALVKKGPNTISHMTSHEVMGVVRGSTLSTIYCSTQVMRTVTNDYFTTTKYLLPDERIMLLTNSLDTQIRREIPVIGSLIGLTTPEAYISMLPDGEAAITYYDGYDESIFADSNNFALVSKDVLEWEQDGSLQLNIQTYMGVTHEEGVDLKIIGTVTGVDEGTVLAPFLLVSGLCYEADGVSWYTESLRATIADNRDLVEFKQTAARTFFDVGVFINTQTFALTIFDAEFYDITEALMQTIFFIDIATPFVYFISICVGFVASFLLTRRRNNEFAIMRSAGVGKFNIFFGTLFEQMILCALGVALGCFLFWLTWGYVYYERPLIFLGCYVLGTVFSAGRAASTDVLTLLRNKE